tara:strand:+ start:319 stop:561 length:243 start_codon:yes stop_codon:yes gene_type:complete
MYKTDKKIEIGNNSFTVDQILEFTKDAMDGNRVTTQRELAEKYGIDDNEYYSITGDIKRVLRMIVQTGVDSKLNKDIRKL